MEICLESRWSRLMIIIIVIVFISLLSKVFLSIIIGFQFAAFLPAVIWDFAITAYYSWSLFGSVQVVIVEFLVVGLFLFSFIVHIER